MVVMVFLAVVNESTFSIAVVKAPFALTRGGASPIAPVRFYDSCLQVFIQHLNVYGSFIYDLTSCALKHIVQYMKRLTIEQKIRVVAALVEGNSIRSTVRMTGVAKNTVIKLVLDLADACATYHDANVRNLKVRRLQCDEIWQYVGAKAKNVRPEKKAIGWGDVWTWTGLDADTKLCVSYLVGGRDLGWAKEFMEDCASRIRNRVQITTDGHKSYLEAVENAFGADIDYAQLQKIYGAVNENETRYSPAKCIGCDIKVVSGNPDPKHVSTSFVERQNLSMRMSIRRFTRLTNAFSKKIENHAAAVAIWFMYYNFCRVHSTLRVTPAMEAGISDHIWSLEELCALLPKLSTSSSRIEKELILKALGD